MKRTFLFSIFSILISINIVGQVDIELNKYILKYPTEEAVNILISKSVNISIKNNKPLIIEESKEESILLTDRSAVLATNIIAYSDFNQLISDEAYSLIPENNKYKKREVKEIENYKESNTGIFYDDSKIRKFIYPGLIKGAKTILNTKMQYHEPWIWGSYYFTNGNLPVENMEYTVTFPEKVKIVWKVIGDDSSKVSFTQTKSGKKNVYRWTATNLPKINFESDGPNFKWYVPILMIGIQSYIDDNEDTVRLMDGHKYMYQWYRKMVNNTQNVVLPEMKKLVDSLTTQLTTEREKVQNIYTWTQDNISYVAFEDGYAGFTPKNAQDVFLKRYGDCKGKANLLRELLAVAGIKSYLTWIGTIHLPYKRDAIPGKPVDNHMIVTYISSDDKYYFLDPTEDFITMDFPSSFIQGKEALIGIDDSTFKIMEVPIIDESKNTITNTIQLKIIDNKLVGNGETLLNGYEHFTISASFRNLTYDKMKINFTNYFEKGNNKFKLDTLFVENIYNRGETGKLKYLFTIPDYINTVNDKLFVNLNLDKIAYYKPIKEEGRQCDVFWRFKEAVTYKYILTIPQGYEVESIPTDISMKTPDFGFAIKYTKTENQIILEKELYSSFIMLNIQKIAAWNKMIKSLDKSQNQSIVLKLK